METLDLVPVWTVILGLGVFFYVLLDGFDLGVGMLYGLAPDLNARNLVMYGAGLVILARIVRNGPAEGVVEPPIEGGRPGAPVTALPTGAE